MALIARMEGGNAPIDGGTYPMICTDIKPDEIENSQFDPRVYRFLFETTEVVDAEGKPIVLDAISSRKLTPNSKLTRWVNALIGHIPTVGDSINLEEVVGKECLAVVVIKKTDQGGEFARIDDIVAAPKRATRSASEATQKPAQAQNGKAEGDVATDEQMAYVGRLIGDLRNLEPEWTNAHIRERMGLTTPVGTRLTVAEVTHAIDWLKKEIEGHPAMTGAVIPF